MWTGEQGEEICQDCWESECSRSWWKMVGQLDRLGLLEATPNDQDQPLPPDGDRGRH